MKGLALFILLIAALFWTACGGKAGVPEAKIESGKKIYGIYCQSCHMDDGSGVPNMNAPLIKSNYVNGEKEKLVNIVLHGSAAFKDDPDRTYTNIMPAVPALTNSEIADVLTYIRNSFGNKGSEVTPGDVELARKNSTK